MLIIALLFLFLGLSMLASSLQGAIVYAAAFLVWGIGSGIIFYKN
jgi:predicted membrane protein